MQPAQPIGRRDDRSLALPPAAARSAAPAPRCAARPTPATAGPPEQLKHLATRAFFEQAVGWRFTAHGPAYQAFAAAQAGLDGGFFRSDRASSTRSGAALVVLYRRDLEGCLDRVRACGGRIEQPIFDFPGGRRFHFAEPGGNELAVWGDSAAGLSRRSTTGRAGCVGLRDAATAQVFLLMVMVGNLAEKSLAFCATLTATWRAMPR
ncbi:VOC family protein [Xenophilus sp. Marseille-Q4582]|uniref:VOC family protein n=1 Tax=Xenophilus sp. Marseille-Q4582 TaxID=2866600 RepID=UPI001CE4B61D|nr:VOC family protein [Xenophilus sp. Marseille-Q4582]